MRLRAPAITPRRRDPSRSIAGVGGERVAARSLESGLRQPWLRMPALGGAGLFLLLSLGALSRDADETVQAPVNALETAPLPGRDRNDCALRAAAFVLSVLGAETSGLDLASLLADRYVATGGRPAGEGYSLAELKRLMAHFGLVSRAGRADLSVLRGWHGPSILRLPGRDGGHFVVLHPNAEPDRAGLYDPSWGQLEVYWGTLMERWAAPDGKGIALFIQPPEAAP